MLNNPAKQQCLCSGFQTRAEQQHRVPLVVIADREPFA